MAKKRRVKPYIDRVDFKKLHRALALSPWGHTVWVYKHASDGTPAGGIVVTGAQETPGDIYEDKATAAYLKAWGPDECDPYTYAGDLVDYNEDTGKWIHRDTRRPVGDGTWEAVVKKAIRESTGRGDWYWNDLYEMLEESILDQWGE